MAGAAIKLPLSRNSLDGFALVKDLRELTRQNLKMLILTSPGERMMDPDFGVGLRRYLFRAKTVATTIEIKNNIQEQIDRYLSVISLTSVDIDGIESPGNKIFVRVNYFVPSLGQFDILEFKFDTD